VKTQKEIDFDRVKKAIEYIDLNFRSQPSLDQVASEVKLSPIHFQKLFKKWAGVSPKKFLQFTSVQYAKNLLQDGTQTLFDVVDQVGLSSTGRLHDLFVKIEAMTPGEYKNGGKKLNINYGFFSSYFGSMLIASTEKGICHLTFISEEKLGLQELQNRFPHANYHFKYDKFHQGVKDFFDQKINHFSTLNLHIKGTDFQLKVWQALLTIKQGDISTYGKIANEIKSPKASRAVGTAIGKNPIAYIIPCHRVIQATGNIGGYMWGPSRKKVILGWEAAKQNVAIR